MSVTRSPIELFWTARNIHAKKYPKIYSQHPFWGTWMPWGGPGGSKSSEGGGTGFFAPNRKVQKPNIVCIYPINNSPVVKIENFEISILSSPPIAEQKSQCTMRLALKDLGN